MILASAITFFAVVVTAALVVMFYTYVCITLKMLDKRKELKR